MAVVWHAEGRNHGPKPMSKLPHLLDNTHKRGLVLDGPGPLKLGERKRKRASNSARSRTVLNSIIIMFSVAKRERRASCSHVRAGAAQTSQNGGQRARRSRTVAADSWDASDSWVEEGTSTNVRGWNRVYLKT